MTSTNHTTFVKDRLARSFKSLGAITGAITLLALILITAQVIAQGTVIDPAAGQETMRVIGTLEEGELGHAVASGDVNGDGYDDLVVAAPYATIVSGTQTYTGSGAIYLILGRPNISSTWDLTTTTPNILFYGECSPFFVCPEWVGSDVSVSDVNGDELDDIVIGAERYGGQPGAAFVFVGRSTLTTTDYITVDIKTEASSTEMGHNLKIASPTPYDWLGHSTATGDLNNDGYDDLIMGAHRANPDASSSFYPPNYQDYQYAAAITRTEAGALYVTLGSSEWVSNTAQYHDLQMCLQSYTVYGKDDEDFLGRSVASGDVNGDGYADIIVSAVGGDGVDSSAPITDSGEVYVFWGSDAITYPIPSTCPADVYTSHIIVDLAYTSTVHTDGITIGHTSDVTIYGASAYDWAGWDVSSADLNGDGYDDIIIGAPGDTQGHSGRYGKVHVIYGEMTPNPTIYLSETADLTIVGVELDDRTGESVSAADLNQDGYDDLIVGAIQADHDGRSNAGKAYVFYGAGGGGLTGTIYLSETDAAHITFLGENSDDGIGKGLGAGDLNHDNVLDLLVGAPGFDANGGNDEGILYTLAGDAVRGVTLTGELPTVVAGQAATYTLAAWNRYADWDVTPISTGSGRERGLHRQPLHADPHRCLVCTWRIRCVLRYRPLDGYPGRAASRDHLANPGRIGPRRPAAVHHHGLRRL